MVSKACSRKADQSGKPDNAITHGQCMSVAIMYVAWSIKWNRPSVTFQSVFQNPVKYIIVVINYNNNLPTTITVMAAMSLPIGSVTVHMYVPLSLVVTLTME